MDKFLAFLKGLWAEVDSVIELFLYLGIAFAISKLFSISFLAATGIVCVYFILNLLRVVIETIRARYR